MSDSQLVRCPACHATNRIKRAKIIEGNVARCGRCKNPLLVTNGPVTVTDATFAAEVERSPLPVLLDLWAPWCGPCRMIAPVLEELAAEMSGVVRVAKMNVDENQGTANRFNVRSIPTLLILKEGREVDRLVGVHPKSELIRHIQQAAA
jgi:thioredoxin 2